MSAALAWDLSPAPARVPVRPAGPVQPGQPGPVRPARPRLVLVPTGAAAEAPTRRAVRLTRAGRLAVTLTVAAVLVALGILVFGGSAGGAEPAIDHATTVRQGQTLSQVAAEQLPQLPLAEAVAQIQVANNLPGSQVHAGQTLVIPAAG